MTRRVLEAIAVLIALAILVAMLQRLSTAHGLALANGQPVFGDFIAFWSAGRAALDGQVAQIHDPQLLYSYHKLAAPDVRFFAPWNSPPTFLLVMAPFAALPYPAAALIFLALTGALYLVAARKLLPDARALIFAVTMPAAFYHLGTVQALLLIAAINGLALLWLDKRPLAAGAMIGLMAIKPHLALLWPLMLALSGRWRVFGAAAVSAAAFVVVAGLVFGFESYVGFIENLQASTALISDQRITTPAYASLYANLLSMHAPQWIAIALHALSALAGVSLAAIVFRRGDRTAAGAALCAAALLLSPYLFFYDFALLGVAAAVMGAPRDRFELAAFVLAWGAGLSLAVGYFIPVPLCPLAAWAVLAAAFRRVRAETAAAVLAPTPQP